jgi:hypothetical protein
MSTDLTVIVTVHDETAVCGPTMRAADLAVESARERGMSVQTVLCLDAATEATTTYFHQPHFDHWERRVLPEDDRGKVSNALAADCDGRYLAFLSADDLCSENWLAEGVVALDAAAGRGEQAIAHPELNVVFDGQKMVRLNIDQDSPLFTPHFLCFGDYYDSPCIAPREAHLEHAHQNVEFTIETMRSGWRHIVVKDTIIFKRHRELSLGSDPDTARRAPLAGALPAMAIDRIRNLGSLRR